MAPIGVRGTRRQGQKDGEGTSGVGAAADPDLAAEVVGDLVREGETEAGAVGAGRALRAVEAVEDMRYLGLGDAAAAVGDADDGAPVGAGEREVHGRAFLRVLEGVVHEDGEGPVELYRVGLYERHVLLHPDVQRAARVTEIPAQTVKELFKVDLFGPKSDGVRVQSREVEQGTGKVLQALGLGAHVSQELGSDLLVLLVLQHLQVSGEGGQGRLELVGGVGDELGLDVLHATLFGDVAQDCERPVFEGGGPDLDDPVPGFGLGVGHGAVVAGLGEHFLQAVVKGAIRGLEELAGAGVEKDRVEVLVDADDRVGHAVEYGAPALSLLFDLVEGPLQRDGHRVERGAQRAHLVLDAGVYPLVEVPGGEPIGGDPETANATRDQDRREISREPRDEQGEKACKYGQALYVVERRLHVLDVALGKELVKDDRPRLATDLYRMGVGALALARARARLDRRDPLPRPSLRDRLLHHARQEAFQIAFEYLAALTL